MKATKEFKDFLKDAESIRFTFTPNTLVIDFSVNNKVVSFEERSYLNLSNFVNYIDPIEFNIDNSFNNDNIIALHHILNLNDNVWFRFREKHSILLKEKNLFNFELCCQIDRGNKTPFAWYVIDSKIEEIN